MAASGIIGAAIGVLLLIIVAYVLVGNVVYSADIITNAQKDMTLLTGVRTGTDFKIVEISQDIGSGFINISICNTGSEVISDFSHMDIFVNNTDDYQYLTLDDSYKTTQLGPDTTTWINATSCNINVEKVVVVTGNGVYDSALCMTLTGISPVSGPIGGGTTVTIAGTNFVPGAYAVTFGNVGSIAVWVNGNTLRAVTPASTGTDLPVVITNGYGQTVRNENVLYTYS